MSFLSLAIWLPILAGVVLLALGRGLWNIGDKGLIDGLLVNGSARLVGMFAGVVRLVQTGHLYWYALVMILGVFGLLTWQLGPYLQSVVLSVAH